MMWRIDNPCTMLLGIQVGGATMENSMEVPRKHKNTTIRM